MYCSSNGLEMIRVKSETVRHILNLGIEWSIVRNDGKNITTKSSIKIILAFSLNLSSDQIAV